jgi:hypothetical protein
MLMLVTIGAKASAAPPVADAASGLLTQAVDEFSGRSGPDDTRYFARGVWRSNDMGCWFCQTAPGTAAAILWRDGGRRDPRLRALAMATFDTAIRENRNRDGSFGDRTKPDTVMFAVELGAAYLELNKDLGPAREARWRRALVGAAEYLIRRGNLEWYTNGNINLHMTMLLQIVWQATGEPRFAAAYDQSWAFMVAPPQDRWRGFGLRISRVAANRTGSDGAGFLAESGGGRPGFDGDYAQLQLTLAARLWLISGDPRALRLTNLLANYLLDRVDDRGLLNVRGGTRTRWQKIPFLSPGIAVLALRGGRRDLLPALDRQWPAIERAYVEAIRGGGSSRYRGLSQELGLLVQVTDAPPVIATRRASTPRGGRR